MNKAEKMYALVEQYRNSSLSLSAFSQTHGIKPSTFSYWVQKKRKMESKDTGKFIPVIAQAEGTGYKKFEIIYPNGVRLRLSHFDKDQISQLVNIYGC